MAEDNKTDEVKKITIEAKAETTSDEEAPKEEQASGTSNPFEDPSTSDKAHDTGERIGRTITGLVITGGAFIAGFVKGVSKPIVDKVNEVSKESQDADIKEQASSSFDKGVKAGEDLTGQSKKEDKE